MEPERSAKERSSADAAYIFGIDLEDVRTMIPDGLRRPERVPANVELLLGFLERHRARVTFFTVGNVARSYPDLVRRIAQGGHEIGCHTSEHLPLDHQDAVSLREDLLRNIDDLERAGATKIRGFRAPIASLTRETAWAYDVLAELGFEYSSSVLAARNPLYGWPEFGTRIRRMPSGIWEMPVSVSEIPGLRVPFAGGTYFRLLPLVVLRRLFREYRRRGDPVLGYVHPYDVDTEQERFMHPGIGGSRLYNRLMFVGRSRVLPRLDRLVHEGLVLRTYGDYLDEHRDRLARGVSC